MSAYQAVVCWRKTPQRRTLIRRTFCVAPKSRRSPRGRKALEKLNFASVIISCSWPRRAGTMTVMAPLFKRQKRIAKYFGDLPYEAQLEAGWLYRRMIEKWGRDVPGWRKAILIGQARRWAMLSADERSRWGRSMLAKRGGYAVQRKYQIEGRTGKKHPAHKASAKSAISRKQNKQDQDRRASSAYETAFQPRTVMQSTDRGPQLPKLRSRLLPLW